MLVCENAMGDLSRRLLTVSISEERARCVQEVVKDLESNGLLGNGTEDFYLVHNGKIVSSADTITNGLVHIVPRQRGGKGGFGSMLRAIGAQIEKTTNREACRDLSGRRLRDINEEKRLKNWIAQQAERERENAVRHKKRLERMCTEPRHEFKDQTYEQERSELTEKVSAAVEQGFKAALSDGTKKRKLDSKSSTIKKKKPCLWLDANDDFSGLDSDNSLGSEEEKTSTTEKLHASPNNTYVNLSSEGTECKPSTSRMVAETSVKETSAEPSVDEILSDNCESGSSSYGEAKSCETDVCVKNDLVLKST